MISGYDFWFETELGKALAKRLPDEVQRVIIDIPIDGVVTIYYQSVDTKTLQDLDWATVVPQIKVVSSDEDKTV